MQQASPEIRKMVIDNCKQGKCTKQEASRVTGYSRVTIHKWCKNEEYEAKPKGHRKASFSDEELISLKEFIEKNNDATLEEIREYFGKTCSLASVWRAIKKLGITFKKKVIHADERDSKKVLEQRKDYMEEISYVPINKLLFLDETAAQTDMTRRYGRSKKGERCVGSAPGSWKSLTILGMCNLKGDIESVVFEGALDKITFESCMKKFFIPHMSRGDTLVLDNLNSHKSEEIAKLCSSLGINIIFLPPYSPDLNPIEKLWSKVKTLLRGMKARGIEALERAIAMALDAVTPSDIKGWYPELSQIVVLYPSGHLGPFAS